MPAIKFRGVDFVQFDNLLTDDERLVRDTTRQFIEDNLIPIIEECNRQGRFPKELVKPMADLGYFGASLKGYGCAGMSNVEYGLVMQELERGDSGVRSFVSVQSALVMYPIYAFGSEEQKQKWLPALQTGEKLGCFGLTEPDFGSNPGGMRTRARKVGNEYVINGEKMWITSGTIADVAVIWAKVENENDKVRGFIVETDRPGFKADDVHGKWSLRASVTSGLSLQDVHVPECNLLPKSGGLKSPLMCLNQARYGIAWGGVGAAMACYDTALQYSLLRKQFRDQPIASHQLVQEKLAWMITEITKGQLLILQVGRLKDAEKVEHQHISMAKRNNVWMALECARMARDILGANGIADDYPIMRHMMNLESVKTYEGTHDIHTLIIGSSVTGIDAFWEDVERQETAKTPVLTPGDTRHLRLNAARRRMNWERIRMRISRLDKSQVDKPTAEIYDVYMKERGNVPNMFRTVAHRPEILRTMIAHFRAVMNTGTIPAKLKELVIVRTSQINRCEYWLASHTVLARRHGWSEEQTNDLANFEKRNDFTAAEKAALRLAERMTVDSHTIDDELWSELRKHYDEGEIIELAAAIGLFNYFNRFNDALKMEPTK